ncbi:hypothetical protein CASFOL_021912 [Castilleja foliolosa]|uniref:F-box domain-containing protein n=1 Tax=Castilleja foliolosa TaxID=1961234 RepID=A0ABD3CXY0_9LAMI
MKRRSVRRKKQSVKRRRVDDDDGSAIAIDRLSQLPQPILHNILSLLSQRDAVRTSVLSKSWRYLWHGRLNVEFRDHWFPRKKVLLSFLDRTLQRYLDQNLTLQKFLVDMYHYEVDFVLLQKWIPLLIMNICVRSFNISFHESSIFFPLPLVVFQSESLVELHLQRCDLSILKSTHNVMLNNLQTLHLEEVDITDKIFEKIISGCPLIENLDVLKCIGMKSIKLHKHHNIKDFCCSVDEQTIIEIEDPHTLESFNIQNYCPDWFLPHTNMHFPHLKSLKLHRVQLPAETFDYFSSFFPCLNELRLTKCDGLKEILLLSSSIKRLTIKMDTKNRIKAFIDTPNILYFEYSCVGFLPSIEFATTSNVWNSKITVVYKLRRSRNDATFWFLELNKLLKALSQSHITLILRPNKYNKLHINDSYGSFYKPVVVEHLKFRGRFSSSGSAILNCFFRVCRPCYLHMDLFDRRRAKCNFAEYISKLKLIPYETGCFWLQDLEEVSTEVWKKKAKEWRCIKGTILPALRSQQKIRFRLTWKEHLSKFT